MMNDVNWIQQTIPAILFFFHHVNQDKTQCGTTQRHFFLSPSLPFFEIMTFYYHLEKQRLKANGEKSGLSS